MENSKNPIEGSRQDILECRLDSLVCRVIYPDRIFQHSSEDPPLQLFESEPSSTDSPVQSISITASRPYADRALKYVAEIELNNEIFSSPEEFRDLINAVAPRSSKFNQVDGVYFKQVEHNDIVEIQSETGSNFAAIFGFHLGTPRITISNDLRVINDEEMPLYDLEVDRIDTSREAGYMQDFLTAFMHVLRAVPHTMALTDKTYESIYDSEQIFDLIPTPTKELSRHNALVSKPAILFDDNVFNRYMTALLPVHEFDDNLYDVSATVSDVPGIHNDTVEQFKELKSRLVASQEFGALPPEMNGIERLGDSPIRPRFVVIESEDSERAYEIVSAFARDKEVQAIRFRINGNEYYSRSSKKQKAMFAELKEEIGLISLDSRCVVFVDNFEAMIGKNTNRRTIKIVRDQISDITNMYGNVIFFGRTTNLEQSALWDSQSFNWSIRIPEQTFDSMREVIAAQLAEIILHRISSGEESYIAFANKDPKNSGAMFGVMALGKRAVNLQLSVNEVRTAIIYAESRKRTETMQRQRHNKPPSYVKASDISRAMAKIASEKIR